jgi:Right handed beta helix region
MRLAGAAMIGQPVRRVFLTLLILWLPGAALALPIAPARPQVTAMPRILMVGAGQAFLRPSDAALVAGPGDTVRIMPGRYVDCAVWNQDDLTIEGVGNGVVLADLSCQRKAIFVISGTNVTVRNVTFTGAHVINHNGAGIKEQGVSLTVDNVRFIDNEEGILTADDPASTIIVRNSYFRGNGTCIAACAHGVYAGHVARLLVQHCEFVGQHQGHHIKSRARRTEVVDSVVRDGPDGSSSYLIDIPEGGSILVRGNRLQKGPHAENRSTAIAIGAERNQQQDRQEPAEIDNNIFDNETGAPVVFVRNYSDLSVRMRGNRLAGAVTPLAGRGSVDGRTVQPH